MKLKSILPHISGISSHNTFLPRPMREAQAAGAMEFHFSAVIPLFVGHVEQVDLGDRPGDVYQGVYTGDSIVHKNVFLV